MGIKLLFSRKKIFITSGYWAIFVVVRDEKVAAHFPFFTSLALKFKTKQNWFCYGHLKNLRNKTMITIYSYSQ